MSKKTTPASTPSTKENVWVILVRENLEVTARPPGKPHLTIRHEGSQPLLAVKIEDKETREAVLRTGCCRPATADEIDKAKGG